MDTERIIKEVRGILDEHGHAVSLARATLQSKACKEPGKAPSAAPKLVKLNKRLQLMRHDALEVARDHQAAHEADDADFVSTIGFALRLNNLKLISSEMVAEIATGALGICGFQGYLNESPNSVTRHIRDALSAALRIGNDRIEQTNASLLLVCKGE